MLAMTISHSLSLALTASVLAVGWVAPAPATELAVPAVCKVANWATPAKKLARRHSLVRIASAELPPSVDNGPRWAFPVVLGVAF
jgi:hypothetical protein